MSKVARGSIISLNYHEITKDPRVLKQARALQQAGFDVHVLCDWPEGLPKVDTIDGVKVTRFECFSSAGVRVDILDRMTFLKNSRPELEKRFLPYAEACEYLAKNRSIIERTVGVDFEKRVKSSYWRKAKGLERWRRFFDYLRLKVYLKLLSKEPNRNLFRDVRRNLFQAQSLVFAANLPDLDTDENIVAVHAHDIYCLPAGVMLANKHHVPLIYDAHEYEPGRGTKMHPTDIENDGPNLPELIENDCFPHVARIITVSHGIGDLYAARFHGPKPTIVMNAPEVNSSVVKDKAVVRDGLKTVRELAELDESVSLVVFTGGVQREKRGTDKVVEALQYLPLVQFALLGPRLESDDKWLMSIARKFKVENRLTFLSGVDARDVPAVISSATVAVIPMQDSSLNHRLAMPNKLFEAAFANVPICVADLPEIRNFVETLGNGRVMDQTDPRSIAAALRDVIDHRASYCLDETGRRKLIEIYSWQSQITKLLELYKDLIDKENCAK